jgi:hypothetical protein
VNDRFHQKSGRIDKDVPFSPADLLRPVVTVEPPFSVVFTDCESMTAAEG